jgi:hypothetical protein
MAQVPILSHEDHWVSEIEALRLEYKQTVKQHPDAKDDMERVYNALNNIASVAVCTPKQVGKGEEWTRLVRRADEGRRNLCRQLEGKSLFSALYEVLSLALIELKAVLQHIASKSTTFPAQAPQSEGEFREQKYREMVKSNDEERPESTKKQGKQRKWRKEW